MNKKKPLVTIITVCYNSAETISDTITSILNQTYDNYEYIIIDGESKDNTIQIIESFENKFLKKNINYNWITEPDNGIYDAMNKGLKFANGDIIGVLNSDDWYELNTIEKVISMKENDVPSIFSGVMNRVNSQKKVYKTMYNKQIENVKNFMPINHPATFVSKEVYNKVGFFDTGYKLSADYDFIFRAYNSGIPFFFSDDVFVNMRNTGATGQIKNLWVSAKEDYEIQKKNKIKRALFNYIMKFLFNCLVAFRDIFIKPLIK